MSGAVSRKERVSVAEYLAAEQRTPAKHEYVDGVVYAMGGASDRHNIIAGNLFAALHAHLPDRCQVFMADMKLRVRLEKAEIYYYPDILVSCAADDRAQYHREKPMLLVEVLSESTARVDRTEKLDAYRRISTLEEYVIAEQDLAHVEIYRRVNGWKREVVAAAHSVTLKSVDLTLPLGTLYRRTGVSG